jgi:hypothetical protein
MIETAVGAFVLCGICFVVFVAFLVLLRSLYLLRKSQIDLDKVNDRLQAAYKKDLK